jgi:hypothetical protein
MKSTELKKLIKEAVKEAIQEEMKDILLEAVRAPKVSGTAIPSQVMEGNIPPQNNESTSSMTEAQKREAYQNILGGMGTTFNTNQVPQKFTPGGVLPGGDLPPGEVDMSQIAGLMNKR